MTAPEKVLVLWDVDGTLTSLVQEPVMLFHKWLSGLPIPLTMLPDKAYTHGRSEREIVEEILRRNTADPVSSSLLTCALRLLQLNSNHIREEYEKTLKPLPGVVDTLEWMKSHQIPASVVTGNGFQAACDKLASVGIDELLAIPCGGYADDQLNRHELIQVTIIRCEEWFRRTIDRSRTIYIGDTPHDIEAARKAGIRCVSVATGEFSEAVLRRSCPEMSLRNLAVDGERFQQMLMQLIR
jgi:phosphoglycolate phosphatase